MAPMPTAYADARRTEILDAALRVFVRGGVNGATMQQIATEAGLSVGAIYRYFENKDALAVGVMQACEAEGLSFFEQVALDATAAGGTPLEHLRSSGRVAWSMFEEPNAREQALIALETTLAAARSPGDPIAEFARQGPQRIIEGLTAQVAAAQAAGDIDDQFTARGLALLLYACHLGTRDLIALFGQEGDAEGILSTLLAVIGQLTPKGR